MALRYTVPQRNIVVEDITSGFSSPGYISETQIHELTSADPLFIFDPNTVSYDTLIRLGLSSGEARTLISYRNKGGAFREPSDIKKIYGLEDYKAQELMPFIEIKRGNKEQKVIGYGNQNRSLIDINRCDSAELVSLPGIGPVLSARIIKFRQLLGGFAKVEQMKEVYGLPEETYALIKESLFVDTTLIKRVDINSADYRELVRFPYLENYDVTAILKYRELNGRINGIADLIENNIISETKAVRVLPYLRFE